MMARLEPLRRAGAAALLASTILGASGAAFAQDAAPVDAASDANEIIVTATKRSESIQKVPISMQALGNETLDQHQVKSFDDCAKLLPSVSYQTYGPSQSDIAFRGIATGGINNGGQFVVGFLGGNVKTISATAMLNTNPWSPTAGPWKQKPSK